MIYLKFLAAWSWRTWGACAHMPRTFARMATAIRCLIWLSLYGGCRVTDFSANLPLPATQVHIKARSSCITAVVVRRKETLSFLPSHFSHFHLLHSSLFRAFLISPLLPLSPLPTFSAHATPRCSRVYPVSRTHGEMYVQKPHIKTNINTCVTTSYDIHDNVI